MTFQAGKNLDNRADARGKVWQRWNDQVIGGAWDGSLKRYVYDGGQLVQEHLWDVMEDQGSWVYTYNDIDRDYLRHQGGIRQREGTATAYNDFYLQQSGSSIEIKTQRDQASATIARAERTQSLNRIAGTTFTDISNLATSNSPVAMYGGGTSGSTGGFDGLVQRGGGGGYLAGVAVPINGGLSSANGGGGFLVTPPNFENGSSNKFGINPDLTDKAKRGRAKRGKRKGDSEPVNKEYECNCEDCRELIEENCDIIPEGQDGTTWHDFCCEVAICKDYFHIDPCAPYSSCKEMICGSEADNSGGHGVSERDCICGWLNIKFEDDTLGHAQFVCGTGCSPNNCGFSDWASAINVDLANIAHNCSNDGCLAPEISSYPLFISPNICCRDDIEDWVSYVQSYLSIACEWLVKILYPSNPNYTVGAACCDCIKDKIADRVALDCRQYRNRAR
jgi:hypothetical protein